MVTSFPVNHLNSFARTLYRPLYTHSQVNMARGKRNKSSSNQPSPHVLSSEAKSCQKQRLLPKNAASSLIEGNISINGSYHDGNNVALDSEARVIASADP